MVENVDLIKGIFSHFNLDMRTHCKYSPPPAEDHEELEELPAEAPAEQVGEELEEPLEETRRCTTVRDSEGHLVRWVGLVGLCG